MNLNFKVNNRSFNLSSNGTILQVVESLGITIPKFCYHPKLNVAGNCRMCLIEVKNAPKPIASCAAPLQNNSEIFTDSPLALKARENISELLLLHHPLDCKICEQGGQCDLQEHTFNYGSDRGRLYLTNRRFVLDKQLGPIVKTVMTRCIHCTRCVRFLKEVSEDSSLGTFGRGSSTEIGTYINKFIKTELSGNLVDLCPVGALTSKPIAFRYRSWELEKKSNYDLTDTFGTEVLLQIKNSSLKEIKKGDFLIKITPKINELRGNYWLSDRTRYGFLDSINNENNRLLLDIIITKNSHNYINNNSRFEFLFKAFISLNEFYFNRIENKNILFSKNFF